MAFLRKRDFFSKIREQDLDSVLKQISQSTAFPSDKVLLDAEQKAIARISAMICHRYEVRKIFTDILTFSTTTQFVIDDLVEYSEPVYSETKTYIVDDLVSFETTVDGFLNNDIYKNTTAVTDPEVFKALKWSKQAPNASLYVVREPTITIKPGTDFVYNTNLFTGDHDTIKGWDKTNDLFLIRDDNEIRIYYSAADRTAKTNSIGFVDIDTQITVFPTIIEIGVGQDDQNQLSGDLAIIGFMPDLQEWGVTATNPFDLDDNRSQLIKGILIDIVLFDLHALINPRQIPELRGEFRDDAMEQLRDIKDGKTTPKLPLFHDETKGQAIAFGSESRVEHTLFETVSSTVTRGTS